MQNREDDDLRRVELTLRSYCISKRGGLVGTLKREEAGKYTYIFDLSRRSQGLIVAARVTEMRTNPGSSEADWHCTANDDADAVSRALKAAKFEWPSVPGRNSNDFVIKFISGDGSGD